MEFLSLKSVEEVVLRDKEQYNDLLEKGIINENLNISYKNNEYSKEEMKEIMTTDSNNAHKKIDAMEANATKIGKPLDKHQQYTQNNSPKVVASAIARLTDRGR